MSETQTIASRPATVGRLGRAARPTLVGLLVAASALLIGAGPATASPSTTLQCQSLQNQLLTLQESLGTAPTNVKSAIIREIIHVDLEMHAAGC